MIHDRKKSIKISESVYKELIKYCKEHGKKIYKVVDDAVLKYIQDKNNNEEIINKLEEINKKIDELLKKLNSSYNDSVLSTR